MRVRASYPCLIIAVVQMKNQHLTDLTMFVALGSPFQLAFD
jgi:hypothetical protein